jgi:tetratricopeptide (TPR) repeat protein
VLQTRGRCKRQVLEERIAVEGSSDLGRGRAAYERRAWTEAYVSLSRADRASSLSGEDLTVLALSAMMTGREDEFYSHLERAHQTHVDADDPVRASRCALWLGLRLADQGLLSRAGGWLGRAGRLLEKGPADCVERGYLLVPAVQKHLAVRDFAAAHAAAAEAAEFANRFRDADLLALALHLQGRALLGLERIGEGLALLDEAMVGVAADEVSPHVSGLIYCSMIGACRRVYAVRRAHEWTAALAEWCGRQPDLVPFTGRCLAYRAEILTLRGAWSEAIVEARRAAQRSVQASDAPGAAAAHYHEGEAHRLLGDFESADAAFRQARDHGLEPQPGLSLLWLAQDRVSAAAAAIRRAVGETADPYSRARLLPASVEILLAAGDAAAARSACVELESIAGVCDSDVLRTLVAHSCGAVALAEDDALGALVQLRRAWEGWEQVQAPYEGARVRVLLGYACRAAGDSDTATLEFDAARSVFERLGGGPGLAEM